MRRAARRWAWVLGLLVAATGACGPPPPPAKRVEQNLEKVDEERTPDKLVARGKAFAQRGDLTRAEQYLSSALDEGADPNEVLPMLMRICVGSGRYRVAIDHANAELKLRPHNNALRFLLGSLYLAVGNTPEARVEFERIVATEPDHAEAHYALATIARDTEGDLLKADHHFREYLRLSPDGPHAEEARSSLLKSVP